MLFLFETRRIKDDWSQIWGQISYFDPVKLSGEVDEMSELICQFSLGSNVCLTQRSYIYYAVWEITGRVAKWTKKHSSKVVGFQQTYVKRPKYNYTWSDYWYCFWLSLQLLYTGEGDQTGIIAIQCCVQLYHGHCKLHRGWVWKQSTVSQFHNVYI